MPPRYSRSTSTWGPRAAVAHAIALGSVFLTSGSPPPGVGLLPRLLLLPPADAG
jgi:hypothetical protein